MSTEVERCQLVAPILTAGQEDDRWWFACLLGGVVLLDGEPLHRTAQEDDYKRSSS